MIFPADDLLQDKPRPTPLYAATAAMCEANVWTSINGYAAARIFNSIESEYNHAKKFAAIADFGPLSRYAVRGEDAGALLSRIVTAPATRLEIGESARGLIVDDHGGVINLAEVSRLTGELFVLTTPSPQPRLLQLGARRLDAVVDDISAAVAVIGVIGPKAVEALSLAGLKTPGDDVAGSAIVRGVETAARPMQFGALPGAEIIFPASEALTVWERLARRSPVAPIGLDAMEVLRIEAGAPRPGADFPTTPGSADGPRLSPAAIGLPHLAPLGRGWFSGRRVLRYNQRTDERRLVTLSIDADRVAPSAAVYEGSMAIGRITTAAWSPSLRRVIAFANVATSIGRRNAALSVSVEGADRAQATPFETPEYLLARDFEKSHKNSTE